MSVLRKLYNFIPLQSLDADANEALREIDDSLRLLQNLIESQRNAVTTIPTQYIEKFGFNDNIGTATTPEDVWTVGGTITWPSAAAVVSATSSSGDDTAAGAGARTLYVEGVDANYDRVNDTITLAGVGAATTTQTFLWVNRAYVATVGATGYNVGNITLSIGGTTVGSIVATDGQTQNAAMVVWNTEEAGKVAYITNFAATVGRTASSFAVFHLHTQEPGGPRRVRKNFIVSNDSYLNDDMFLGPIPAGTRIWARVEEVGQNNTRVHVDYRVEWVDPPG